MYGTPYELSAELMKTYTADTKIALIAWTSDNVTDCLSDYNVTPAEAASITADITLLDEVHVYGVSQDTLISMLDNIRESAREKEEIQVSVRTLEKVIELARGFISREEAEGGEGSAKNLYPREIEALETLYRQLTE
ncbi:DUF1380 family protein [Erwinia amylovora]|uniref:DUF1380 family protein n=1 Tax=Erwinia amylovora TaxID=552 RepID=UPI000C07A393|nr:DUF1380 family protein [Erwinia amylovora]